MGWRGIRGTIADNTCIGPVSCNIHLDATGIGDVNVFSLRSGFSAVNRYFRGIAGRKKVLRRCQLSGRGADAGDDAFLVPEEQHYGISISKEWLQLHGA